MKIPSQINAADLKGMNIEQAVRYITRSNAAFYLTEKEILKLLLQTGAPTYDCFDAAQKINKARQRNKKD